MQADVAARLAKKGETIDDVVAKLGRHPEYRESWWTVEVSEVGDDGPTNTRTYTSPDSIEVE